MKNLTFTIIAILLVIMAGKSYAAENTPKTATITPSMIENLSPEAVFDKIRDFLTFPAQIPNISAPALETPNFDTSGIQNLNDQIRDITGVDILQFLNFLWNIFLVAVRYLIKLLSRTAG